MVNADYKDVKDVKDVVKTFYAVDNKELKAVIKKLKFECIPIKFVSWTKNYVSYYIHEICGVTYG